MATEIKYNAICKCELNLIKNTLENFKDELQFYCDAVKDNPYYKKKDGTIDENKLDVFMYNERAVLGFFINSIIRTDPKRKKYCAVQEFSVENKSKKHVGRADLLIMDRKNYFMVEAKHYNISETTEKKWFQKDKNENCKKTVEQLQEIIEKANKYCIPRKFYKEKTNMVALVFETVRLSFNNPKDYLALCKKDNKIYEHTIENYFHYLYYGSTIQKNVLSVYGKHEPLKKQ